MTQPIGTTWYWVGAVSDVHVSVDLCISTMTDAAGATTYYASANAPGARAFQTSQSPLLAQYAARRQAQLARVASLHSYQERQEREKEKGKEPAKPTAISEPTGKGTPPEKAAPQKSAGRGRGRAE